ncbi:hypothetical protein BGZ95_006050 [Linnemannia exigua]|uniref:Uncharacterized protein n=1 Tax=Linnemannia exigua TaxID=604196 RepID=A0AAD4DGA2_9FUNG|nr:hypothetical protein BGZ95_006050 [Linnemannia exigua]
MIDPLNPRTSKRPSLFSQSNPEFSGSFKVFRNDLGECGIHPAQQQFHLAQILCISSLIVVIVVHPHL